MQVTIKRTVCSPRQFARAFLKAWRELGYDENATQAQCGVIYAQWMVETGGAACWCWNIGNVKVTQAQVDAGVPWFDLPGTKEVIGGQYVTLPDGHPGRRFRAYASLDDGMGEHLRFLRNTRYKHAWRFVEAGDPVGFVHAIKAGADGKEGTWDDYFTAPVEDYVRLEKAKFGEWMKLQAYADALSEVLNEDEVDTIPDGVAPAIVHAMPDTVIDLTVDPDDEPPAAA